MLILKIIGHSVFADKLTHTHLFLQNNRYIKNWNIVFTSSHPLDCKTILRKLLINRSQSRLE